jgi:hypothetical protein
MRPFKIPISIYCCTIYFLITDDVEAQVNKLRKKNGLEPTKGPFDGYADEYNFTDYWVIISSNSLNVNTLCHEVFHTVHTITEDRVIRDEEAQAWLCGFISQKIYDYMQKNKLKLL